MFKISFSQIRPAPFADLWETFTLRGSMAGAGINLEQADAFALPMRRPSQQRELPGHLQPQTAVGKLANYLQEDRRLPVFERHVFVCHNTRPAGAPRPCCTADGKSDLHTQLQQISKEVGLAGKVRINKSGCLDQCEHGPTVVVYPEAVWYGNVRPEDAAEIVKEHLVAGRPVERLRLADECINTKTCQHRQ